MSKTAAHHAGPLYWLAVLTGYGLSRVLARLVLGVEFDDNPLIWFWQFIDPLLLREDAIRSIFYHHAQPPLFNIYLAVVTQTCGEASRACFAASFHGFGLALHLALFGLMLRLGVDRRIALCTTLLFAFSPASILYENWLFYTYPVAAVLMTAAVFVHRAIAGKGQPIDLIVLSSLLAAAVLTRSLFHLVWLGGALSLIAWPLRRHWRRVVVCTALPALLCVGVYAKNAALFGSFTSSSWLGMSVARLAIEPIPLSERRAHVLAGDIGAVSLVEPFSPVSQYPPGLRRGAPANHPVLAEPRKSTRAVNFNHGAYLAISRAYLRDARALILKRPDVYMASVFEAWSQFTMAPSIYLFLQTNRDRMGMYANRFTASLYGFTSTPAATDRPFAREDPRYRLRAWGVLFLLLAAGGVVLAAIVGSREWLARDGHPALGATLLFASGTIAYVAVIGNALELGENNRFRFMIEPLGFALIAWLLDRLLRGSWRRREDRHLPETGGADSPSGPGTRRAV